MAQKILVAQLDIDTNKLLTEMQKTKAGIKEMTDENKKLAQSGKETSEAFIRNETEIKRLRSEYRQQQKTLTNVTDATGRLNAELKKEVKTQNEAVASNKELRNIRKDVDSTTKEGAKQVKAINKQIDKNTKLIKDNADGLEKNKLNVGNYTESINKAKIGVKFFGTALKALGLGLFFAGVKKLTEAFGRNQKVMDAVEKVMTFVGIIFDKVVGSIVDAVQAASDATGGFDALGKVLKGTLLVALDSLQIGFFAIKSSLLTAQRAWIDSFLGSGDTTKIAQLTKEIDTTDEKVRQLGKSIVENGKDVVNSFGEAVGEVGTVISSTTEAVKDSLGEIDYKKTFDDAGAIARNKSSIEGLIIAQETLIQKYENEAEKKRQIRDDDTKTNAERLQASNDLLATLDKQGKAEQGLLNLRLNAAQKELSLNKGNIELQNKVAEIKKEQADVENRIQTQYTEYQNSRRALDKEVAEDAIKLAKISLEEYERVNQSKLDHDRYITDEQYRIEVDRLNRIAQKRREFEAERLAQGVISEEEYNAAINQVNADNQVALDEVAAEKKESEAEKDAVDEEIRVAKNQERAAFDNAFAQETLAKRHAAERKEVERLGGDLVALDELHGKEREDVARAVNQNKRDLASNTLGHLATVFGEETAAGKAAAVAQATIDTYSSAVSAFNSLSGIPFVGPVLGGIAAAAAVANGLATVKKITATPKPKAPSKKPAPKAARGMLIGGRRHSQGGTLVEAELGEAIMTRGAVQRFGPQLSAMNQAGGGIPFFETGGVIGGGIAGSTSLPSNAGIDYGKMQAAFVAGARSVTNVVSVEEINTVSNRVQVAENSSSF